MISLDEARDVVLAGCETLPAVGVAVGEALGLVSAAPVVAGEAVPPFANTAVDGYALQWASTVPAPAELVVVGYLPAGAAPGVAVGAGEAIRIMTGAPIPEGADAVAMVEDTEALDDGRRVRILRTVEPGSAVRPAGDDVQVGEEVLAAGVELRAAHLGVLASIGASTVVVHRRPRVAVLSTGDELVEGGRPLGPGQIRESNKAMLLALVASTGAVPVDLGLVRDEEDTLVDVLREAAQSYDAVVTSGGVSMGDVDVVKLVLDRVGRMHWMQIAIKPAKPFAFGLLDGGPRPVPVFGLPGNPVSSMVSFELLARPGIRRLLGHREPVRPLVSAVADEALRRRPDGKVHWMRVVTRVGPDGRTHVRPTGAQGSHQLASTAAATGLVAVPDGDGVPPGGSVDLLPL
jgi:molybdopterin molybdotransferase